MEVQTISTINEQAYLRVCCYGEPGTGKTWFGASACLDPNWTAPCLFVDFRSQVTSVRSNPAFMKAIADGDLVIATLKEYNDLNHIYTYLFTQNPKHAIAEHFTRDAWEGHRMPKTVVIDSATELQRMEVLRLGGNRANTFIRDVQPPEIREWGTLLNEFALLSRLFYELPMHVVFNCLEAVDYGRHKVGEKAPISGYRIAMQGKAQRQFPAYALTLMRLERAKPNLKTATGVPVFTKAYTQAVQSKTKEQTGMIDAEIANPTIPMLAQMLRGKPELPTPEYSEAYKAVKMAEKVEKQAQGGVK